MTTLIERKHFQLDTPEKIAKALIKIKATEEVLKEMKSKVKEKAEVMMNEQKTNEIIFENEEAKWQVKKTKDIETTTYEANKLFEVLGDEAIEMMKPSTTAVEKKRQELMKSGDAETVVKINGAGTTRTRKGNITIREMKG